MSLLGGHSPKEWEPGSPYSQENGDLESPFYGIPIFPWHCMVSLDPRPNPRGRVWGKTLPGSVLSTEMPPSVLMRERTSLQPTSVWVRLMTGSKYMVHVEHRNFEYWSSAWPITLKIWKRKSVAEFRNRAAAFQLDTSGQGFSPDPSSRDGSWVQTTTWCPIKTHFQLLPTKWVYSTVYAVRLLDLGLKQCDIRHSWVSKVYTWRFSTQVNQMDAR